MKKTVLEGKQWIFELLSQSNIRTIITGNIYKDKKPSGSIKEDIVINSISMDGSFLQDGVFNVNCYVPMVSVNLNGITQYMPNNNRMLEISKAVYPIFEDIFRPQFNLTVVNHNTFEEDEEKSNYINFRINLKAYN
ncbi:hypothetical protein CEY12_06235 [Chryseobacterium sp. T16E-39]|uniref:hypothetical protein n=1 Tax=Chryseobacterium sp. T16E-39 TaxID=2015076 RepID=UPI000B5B2482|nr:hypothetical protein [Chryseobacterium sp. T16E-39]ASK29727.1 hypothetical protein CEY12_06235 [Chryseobacterium sp. T16E-39]